jgi:hypothetical protein
MDALGSIYGWIGTHGFFHFLTVMAVLSLPNPLAIIWLGILIVGKTASYLDLGGHNGK